ncbi:MAG: TIGR00730 family Rossman fold protein [Holosporales bacterium]|jgi:uncharacterized protein (TIGR00730 family)|nr:TIGR00730 family Rossman fold protein [Holosporales bacterium]
MRRLAVNKIVFDDEVEIPDRPNGLELSANSDVFIHDLEMSRIISRTDDRLIAFFGGSNIQPGSFYYEQAVSLAEAVSSAGCAVMTGGGPGIMEAANKGASNNRSYGILVSAIRNEFSGSNSYINQNRRFVFSTLSLRLLTLISNSDAVIFFPGGFGTFEELFSLLVREKIEMMQKIPIYLFGSRFWNGLLEWLKDSAIAEGVIGEQHLELFRIEDDIHKITDEIINHCFSDTRGV